MQINYLKNKIFRTSVKIVSIFLFTFLIVNPAYATETYTPSESIVIGEFIYNDDYTPTTDNCTISIYSPAGATLVNEATMSDDATGWHYYAYTIPVTEGKYPTFITCGTLIGGDLLKLDKSFIVKAPNVTDASIASSVWSNGTRSLTTFGTLAADVWSNSTRTLSAFGALAADVWDDTFASNRQLTTKNIAGGGSLATESYIDSSEATVITEIQSNATLINSLNNISAADVWAHGTRSINSGTVTIDSASTSAIWDKATSSLSTSGSVGKLIVDNLDTQVSSRGTSNLTAADVWSSATRTLSSTGLDDVSAAVWANAGRTLTSYGNDITAADVWNTLSSTLTTVGSIGEQVATNLDAPISAVGGASNWTVKMGNVERIQAGYVYRTKVFILDSSATPTAPFTTPTVTLYDTNRNAVVSGISMTLISTGVYEYTYTVANSAVQGLWETVVSSEVESGKTIQTNDYWEVSGSPAQVIINSVTANSLSSILANITITNEGLSGYEYDYEWCVVSSLSNNCGGNDDVYYASAAKFINPSESWNTALSATATTAGTYYFKLVVHFGTDSSSASRVFTVTSSSSGGGGGGGGGGGDSTITNNTTIGGACNGADFNKNKVVDSVDFSILLYFWKRVAPFKNPCVDINVDKKVDSVDFSIMLFQWGKKSI